MQKNDRARAIAAASSAILIAALSGCSADPLLRGKQDPLADQPDAIRNAAPPAAPKPADPREDLLPLTVAGPDFLAFKEGEEGQAKIVARAFDKNAVTDLQFQKPFRFSGRGVRRRLGVAPLAAAHRLFRGLRAHDETHGRRQHADPAPDVGAAFDDGLRPAAGGRS